MSEKTKQEKDIIQSKDASPVESPCNSEQKDPNSKKDKVYKRQRNRRIVENELKEVRLNIAPNSQFVKINFEVALKIPYEELTLETLINIMKKLPNERNIKDLSIMIRYLSEFDFAQKFKEQNLNDEVYQKILYFCAMYIGYIETNKNEILFEIGDYSDKFYFIIDGEFGISKPQFEYQVMNACEYFNFMIDLVNKKDFYVLKMIISENKLIFPVDINHIMDLNEILFRSRYKQLLLNNPNFIDIQNLFELHNVNPETYKINLTDYNYAKKNLIIQQQYYLLVSNPDFAEKLDFYRYLANDYNRKKKVGVYTLKTVLTLKKQQSFGDANIENSKKRNATVVTLKNSILGHLDLDVYKDYVYSEKKKILSKEIAFLQDNYFHNIKNFQEKYYHYFINVEHSRGEVIIKENEQNNFVYFIKEGEFEIYFNRKVTDIINLSKLLNNIISENSSFSYQIKNNKPKNVIDELSKKKLFKLFYVSSKDIIGLEEYFFKINHLYSVKAISDKVKFLKIDVNSLKLILEEEKLLYHHFLKKAKIKVNNFITRLNEIININLTLADVPKEIESYQQQPIVNLKSNSSVKVFSSQLNKKALSKIFNSNLSIMPINEFENKKNKKLNLSRNISNININSPNNRENIHMVDFISKIKNDSSTNKSSALNGTKLETLQIKKLKEQINQINNLHVIKPYTQKSLETQVSSKDINYVDSEANVDEKLFKNNEFSPQFKNEVSPFSYGNKNMPTEYKNKNSFVSFVNLSNCPSSKLEDLSNPYYDKHANPSYLIKKKIQNMKFKDKRLLSSFEVATELPIILPTISNSKSKCLIKFK